MFESVMVGNLGTSVDVKVINAFNDNVDVELVVL
jgi:hypothetical protein